MGAVHHGGDRVDLLAERVRMPNSDSAKIYTIWPADREGALATSTGAWHQDRHWLVLDITDGLDQARIVEGPVSREMALQRQLEIRASTRKEVHD